MGKRALKTGPEPFPAAKAQRALRAREEGVTSAARMPSPSNYPCEAFDVNTQILISKISGATIGLMGSWCERSRAKLNLSAIWRRASKVPRKLR